MSKRNETSPNGDLIGGEALFFQSAECLIGQLLKRTAKRLAKRFEWLENLPLSEALHDGFAQATCAEDAGIGWAEDSSDTKLFGDGAGVLASGTAEGDQRIVGGIIAFADGNFSDRVCHPFVGDFEEPAEKFAFRWRFGD